MMLSHRLGLSGPSRPGIGSRLGLVACVALVAAWGPTAAAAPSSEAGSRFANSNAIAIPSGGIADSYPSVINVPAFSGKVVRVKVTLHGFNHTIPDDVDVLLVGPTGVKVMLMSDVGGGADAVDLTLTLDSAAAAALPDGGPLVNGTFQPTNVGSPDAMPVPAPAEPYATDLGAFAALDPVGNWSLYVFDDIGGFSGMITDGWSLQLVRSGPGDFTGDGAGDVITHNGGTVSVFRSSSGVVTGSVGAANTTALTIPSSGAASLYPSTIAFAGVTGTIAKITVRLVGFNHTFPDDVDVLLVGPTGASSLLLSDAGGGLAATDLTFTFDSTLPAAYNTPPDATQLASGEWRPADYLAGDTFPAPAPAGPYGASLGVFNGTDPNGTWSLYVADDVGGFGGSLTGGWEISVQTTPSFSFGTFIDTAPAFTMHHGDFDGDGRQDFALQVTNNRANPGGLSAGDVLVYRSTGTGFAFVPGPNPRSTWSYGWSASYDLNFADVNGDGRADIIGRLLSTGEVYVGLSTGTAFASPTLWSYGWSSGYDLYFADVTGDGKADLVGRYYGAAAGLTGDVYVGISTGAQFSFSGRWTYGWGSTYQMYLGDVTGDGIADLAGRATAGAGDGQVFVMRSTGSAATGFVFDNASPWATGLTTRFDLFLADLTGSGKAALVSRDRQSSNGALTARPVAGAAFGSASTIATGLTVNHRLLDVKAQSIY